ncbi:hypothetical protein PV703_28805 [Streptomyces sp. ME01-24h]|nr:hypothetical protein [Streptomyces sp. ME01-24h]
MLETIVGTVIGDLPNVVVPPPAFVEPAGDAVREPAEHLRSLMLRMGREVHAGATAGQARSWLMDARRPDNEIARFGASLRRAEEGTRLNPRVRPVEGAMARLPLRSGLETLEVSTALLRTLCRSLTELDRERGGREPVFTGRLAVGIDELFADMADVAGSFGGLIAAQVTEGADRAEARLEEALRRGRAERDRIAVVLRAETEQRWDSRDLYGALLVDIDRLLDELDLEKHSLWLSEQLDAAAPRPPVLSDRIRRHARAVAARLRSEPAGGTIHDRRGDEVALAVAGSMAPRLPTAAGNPGRRGVGRRRTVAQVRSPAPAHAHSTDNWPAPRPQHAEPPVRDGRTARGHGASIPDARATSNLAAQLQFAPHGRPVNRPEAAASPAPCVAGPATGRRHGHRGPVPLRRLDAPLLGEDGRCAPRGTASLPWPRCRPDAPPDGRPFTARRTTGSQGRRRPPPAMRPKEGHSCEPV